MTRISLFTTEYPPFHGGVANFMSQCVECLEGHISSVVVFETKQHERNDSRVSSVQPLKYGWPKWIPVFWKAFRVRKQTEYYLFSSILPLGTIGLLLSLCIQKPYYVCVYGMDIVQHKKGSWKFLLATKIFSRATKIISISSYTSFELTRYDIPKEKILCVHPRAYYIPGRFIPKRPKSLSDADTEKTIILTVSRLVERKNIKDIVRLAHLYKSRADLLFCVAGDGPEYERIHQQASGLSNIRFLRSSTDEEITWLYTHAALTVFAPISGQRGDVEGFGIVALESSSFGKPILATRTGGVPDAVSDGISGLLVPPNDFEALQHAFDTLIDDSEKRKVLGTQGQIRYQKEFSEALQCKRFLELVQKKTAPVAVVIPAYNAEKTIVACLTSLQQQTMQPMELVVVDDGSEDKTAEIVEHTFPQVTLIRQKNGGAPRARNTGADNTQAPFLLFVDADMTCKPHMIERYFQTMKRIPEASFVYASFTFGWKRFSALPFDSQRLRKHNYIHTSSLMKRSVFPRFDETLHRHQDWDLWLTITKKGNWGVPIDDVLYAIHPQKKRISTWVPSFAYTMPFGDRLFPDIKTYRHSERIIKEKHGIS